MFLRKDYAKPGPGVERDAPEKTGILRFIQILQTEAVTVVKLNLLFLLFSLPVATLPPALYAMHLVTRKMVLDEPVLCFYDFRTAFCKHWRQGYGVFLAVAAPLGVSGYGAYFYLLRALESPLLLAPFTLCSTVFLVTLLASGYLYAAVSTGLPLRRALPLSIKLGLGKPLRAVLCALCTYGLVAFAVLEFPLSFLYLLLLGFSLPCLLGNFFLRTVVRAYCPPPGSP